MVLGLRAGVGAGLQLSNSKSWWGDSSVVLRTVVDRPATRVNVPRLGIRCGGGGANLSMEARLVPQPKGGPKFPSPIRSYDVHVYFWQTDKANTELAKSLRQECIEKFQDLNIYKFWDVPIGPHPTGMFEVDLKTPDQFTRFVPWIQVNRRGLSVLVHPNTGQELDDHTINAMWIGEKIPLNLTILSNHPSDYGHESHGIAPPVATE